jgi:serine/threonine-protein kinase RsbW
MSDVVDLTIPASADLVALARLTASTIAARANFDVEEVEDLRLAVDELCVSLVHDDDDGSLMLRFVRDGDTVEVSCTRLPGPRGQLDGVVGPDADDLSQRILDALVDEHGQEDDGGRPRVWLRKRRVRQQA